MEAEYNQSIGRGYGAKPFSCYPRLASHYLTFGFYRAGLRGIHILWVHFAIDMIALYFVWVDRPLIALVCWFTAYILDHCDGDLGRARGEINLKYGEMDVHLHLIGNVMFWIIVSTKVSPMSGLILIGARVITEFHRNQLGSGIESKRRWGEKSKFWHYVTLPTNVNIIYFSYVLSCSLDLMPIYLIFYCSYFTVAALFQSVYKVWQVFETDAKLTVAFDLKMVKLLKNAILQMRQLQKGFWRRAKSRNS